MTDAPTVLITGATDGLGRALASRLAGDGARLLLHGRSEERLAEVVDELAGAPGGRPRTLLADLAELDQVRRLAADVRAATKRLDVLVTNAGIGSGRPDSRSRQVSADGYELRFAVNYLAGFLSPSSCCRCCGPPRPPGSCRSPRSSSTRSTSAT